MVRELGQEYILYDEGESYKHLLFLFLSLLGAFLFADGYTNNLDYNLPLYALQHFILLVFQAITTDPPRDTFSGVTNYILPSW